MKNINKVIAVALTSLTVMGIGLVSHQGTASAAGYRTVKVKHYNSKPYYFKSNKNVYMWNANHTKKLHNLKNYPKTTWYVIKSVKLVKGHKSGIFYQVYNTNFKVMGYVWRNYLTKGINPKSIPADPIKQTIYTKDILSMFKGTKYDRAISDWAVINSDTDDPQPDPRAPEQIANTIYIGNTTTLDYYNPQIYKLAKGKITFKQFLAHELKIQGINPNDYAGYTIAISGWIPGATSETTGVGDYSIILYK